MSKSFVHQGPDDGKVADIFDLVDLRPQIVDLPLYRFRLLVDVPGIHQVQGLAGEDAGHLQGVNGLLEHPVKSGH